MYVGRNPSHKVGVKQPHPHHSPPPLSVAQPQWLARLLISDPRGHRSVSGEQRTSGFAKPTPTPFQHLSLEPRSFGPPRVRLHTSTVWEKWDEQETDRRSPAPAEQQMANTSFPTGTHSQY